MSKLFNLVAASLFCLGIAACNNSPQGGTPGTSDNFTVKAPAMATTIKQGDRQTVQLNLDRGSGFKKKVELDVTGPKELKASFGSKTIQAGDPAAVSLTVEAAPDAPVGDHVLKVTATPEAGAATSVDIKITVAEKK